MATLLKLAILVLFLAWRFYWWISEQKANKEKDKTRHATLKEKLVHSLIVLTGALIVVQLLGFRIWELPYKSFVLQVAGFKLALLGVYVSAVGRKELGTNWVSGHEYQIKKDHTLITSGIYRYIRHPIYSGMFFMLLGMELLVNSYFVLLAIPAFVGIYVWGKKEEAILLQHFGNKYEGYMKRSKMLIPFVY